MLSKSEDDLPEVNKLFFTSTGFGIKSISKESIRKNLKVLLGIAQDAQQRNGRKKSKSKKETPKK